jgi:putative FmdB family regulatory protein
MPIYAYRCATCGHAKDVLQKMSDPLLTVCPACGAQTFVKQLTAAGFQLKGSGWYVTDFKGDSSPKPASGDAKDGDAKPDAAKPDAAAPASPAAPAASAGKTEAAAAPAPAPAAATPPASGAK